MVVATAACVVTLTTAGAAMPFMGAMAVSGSSMGAGAALAGGPAVAGAVGAATSSGAIAGAAATTTMAGAGVGAAIGGTAALGVGGTSAGLTAIVAGTGGWGLLLVGASTNQEDEHITYDCWKPVVHDITEEPSNGVYLSDLLSHPNIQRVTMDTGCYTNFPNIVIENIWKEEFQIEYMMLKTTGMIMCHAKLL